MERSCSSVHILGTLPKSLPFSINNSIGSPGSKVLATLVPLSSYELRADTVTAVSGLKG